MDYKSTLKNFNFFQNFISIYNCENICMFLDEDNQIELFFVCDEDTDQAADMNKIEEILAWYKDTNLPYARLKNDRNGFQRLTYSDENASISYCIDRQQVMSYYFYDLTVVNSDGYIDLFGVFE